MNEAVVSVGMGAGQYNFIKKIKERGYTVIAFGKGNNSREAVDLADYSMEIDTSDAAKAIEWIDSLDVSVVAVGSLAGGRAIETIQKLSNYYSVSTAIPEELIVGNDKINQMLLYSKYGLSSINTWRANQIGDNVDYDMEYIIKPSKGRGSEGITFVNGRELDKLLFKKRILDNDIIQTVFCGEEYRCLIMIQNSEIILFAPIRRESYRDTVFLGKLLYDDKNLDCLKTHFEKFIKMSGLTNCIIKADVLVSNGVCNVIEMDIGVGGGVYFQSFISEIYGRDIVNDYVSLILGVSVKSYINPTQSLKMDYVFNRLGSPIEYEIDQCYEYLNKMIRVHKIQPNFLHPEKKSDYKSNADFILTVVYEMKDGNCCDVDQIINEHVFKKR